MSRRAAQLAERLEQGARQLAEFAQGLSDAEWRKAVPHDGRTVGVTIHHVASVYPIELDLARTVASGQAVTEVTWDAVHAMNAKHAADNASASKQDALDLLRKNSKVAADAIRSFTDEQLDTAAPFSLNSGAPLTAQFVLEDHAVRHSYHHLAKMKAALNGK
jgi:uncharacterized damage-inducible protein DinB